MNVFGANKQKINLGGLLPANQGRTLADVKKRAASITGKDDEEEHTSSSEDESVEKQQKTPASSLSFNNIDPNTKDGLDKLVQIASQLRVETSSLTRLQKTLQHKAHLLRSEVDQFSRHTLPQAVKSLHERKKNDVPELKKGNIHQRTSSGTWYSVEQTSKSNKKSTDEVDVLEEKISSSSDKVFRSGWMYKEGGLVRNWKRRLFILYGTSIEYYIRVRDDKPKGIIQLDTCTITPSQNRPNIAKPCMELVFGAKQRKWHFTSEVLSDNIRWYAAINNRIVTLGYIHRCKAVKQAPDARILAFLNHVPEDAHTVVQLRRLKEQEKKNNTSSSSSSSSSHSRNPSDSSSRFLNDVKEEQWPPSFPLKLNFRPLSLDSVSVVGRILCDCTVVPGGGVSQLDMVHAGLSAIEIEHICKSIANSDFNAVYRERTLGHLPASVKASKQVFAPKEEDGLQRLNLSHNNFLLKSAPKDSLADKLYPALPSLETILRVSTTLTELCLDSCNLGDIGVKRLSQAFPLMTCRLKRLVLSNNGITDVGGVALIESISQGSFCIKTGPVPTKERMSMSYSRNNNNGDDDDRKQRPSISVSDERDTTSIHTLEHLYLDHNKLNDETAIALSQYIMLDECILKTIDLHVNDIDLVGVKALANAISKSATITNLNLVSNTIDRVYDDDHVEVPKLVEKRDEAFKALSKMTQTNNSITDACFLDYVLSSTSLASVRLLHRFGFDSQ